LLWPKAAPITFPILHVASQCLPLKKNRLAYGFRACSILRHLSGIIEIARLVTYFLALEKISFALEKQSSISQVRFPHLINDI
jgi:hypothetical protein